MKKALTGLGIWLYLSSPLQAGSIIVDLGGVLVGTDTATAIRHMGIGNVLMYLGWYAKSPHTEYLAYLSGIMPHDPSLPVACDYDGGRLPQLMYDWLMGTRSCQEIRSIITSALDEDSALSLPSKWLFRSMTEMIFTPEIFIQTRRLYPKMVALITEYKHKGHKIYIGSNWDAESFALFITRYPELAELFDGAIVSGAIHQLKPQREFFEYGIATYELIPQETVLIDDQLENIAGARACGLSAIHCRQTNGWLSGGPDVQHVRSELESWHQQLSGVIQAENTEIADIDLLKERLS